MRFPWHLFWLFCLFSALLLIVRIACLPFSPKIPCQIKKHPVIHAFWIFFAFVGFALVFGILNPAMFPPEWLERRGQRKAALERVHRAGGWNVIREACASLIINHPNGLHWSPNFTDFDDGQIPPAIAALQPKEIIYYPPSFLPKDAPQIPVVSIKIFGLHATGGHSQPYFGLEIPIGKGAEKYVPKVPSFGGVPGNRYTAYRQVADGIFEIY